VSERTEREGGVEGYARTPQAGMAEATELHWLWAQVGARRRLAMAMRDWICMIDD
jgi:hypothetical protein